jgi:pimeloyl-ACP methyl ester carboxylesterase
MVNQFGIRALLLLGLVLLMNGCMFMRLSRDLQQVETKEALIRGRLFFDPAETAPALLLLFSIEDGEKQIVDFSVMDGPGLYAFMVPRGAFRVAAFIDRNTNMRPDVGERFGYYQDPVVVERAGTINGIDFEVDRVIGEEAIDQALWSRTELEKSSATAFITAAGVVADLDHRHFSPEYAVKGLWEPFTTLRQMGIGLFFLEAYDPDKIPVLFVYGASGNARQWRVLFEQMDRERFQPWFFNYPSGLDLAFLGGALNGAIQWLHDRYRFDDLFVVAHSMGGLVARYAILQNVYEYHQDTIRLLVTLSTPWGGHRAAARGVSRAPAVVPSWRNMVPSSPFLTELYRRPLPPEIPHHLFFSYSGRSRLMAQNNDGAVTLESQLDYRVQEKAQRLRGFNENHVTILSSEEMVAVFNQILHDRAASLPKGTLDRLWEGLGISAAAPPKTAEAATTGSRQH